MDNTSKKLLITTLILGVIAIVSGITGVSLLKEPLIELQEEMAQVLSEQIDTTINTNNGNNNADGYVLDVIDGDTIKVQMNGKEERIRMIGIDTPELNGNECFSWEARAELERLVSSKNVKLAADFTQDDRDKYNRLLRYVQIGELDVNYEMIKGGYAKEYTYGKAYLNQTKYKTAETIAQFSGSGRWGKCSNV